MHQENRSGINRQFSDQHNSPKSISLFSVRKKGSRLKLEYHDALSRRSWSCHALMCIMLFITVMIEGGQCRCGGEFSGLYGVVTSENYPLPNTHTGENCTWIIWPLKGTVLFLLKDLNLKGDPTNTAYDCTSHSLEFYNGANGQLIKRICDDNIPAGAIQSLTEEGSLIVIYSIRKTYTKQGFYALFWSSSVTVELPTIVYVPTLLLNCGSKQIQGKQSVTLFRSLDRPVTSNYTPMASIRLGEDRIQDFGSVKGASYSGSIETRISAQINNATCKDSGVYICQIVYRSASNETKSLEIFYPVTVSTEPDRTVLEPNRFKWCYATGSNLTLTCNVSVGKMPEGAKTQLKWQDWTPDIRVWQAYDGVIETDPPFPDSSNDCGVKHVSKLSLTLEAVDTRRFFRCYVVQIGFLENKYEYREFIDSTAAEFMIGNVKNATLPTQSSIQSFPNETQFDLQQVVTLTCNGSIGILQKGYQTDWYWEYSNEGSTQWKSYPVGEHIMNSQVITDNGSDCHLFQSTSLTIKLSDSDSNRRYRCYVGKNKSTSEFTDYRNFSSVFVIRIKKSQVPKYIEAIIGILAGGLLLVLGMVGFHCYLRVQSRRNTLAKPVKRDVCKEPETNTVAAASPELTAKPPKVRLFSSSDDFVERDSTSL